MSASSFRSPFVALVWKEWRESWWLLILTFLAPTAWHLALNLFEMSAGQRAALEIRPLSVGLCFLALSLGAGLFAGERARGTAAFQEERPVSRGTIWNAKFILPILALAGGAMTFAFMAFWIWPPKLWRTQITVEPYLVMAMAFLFFASATMCSVLLDRPVTAWAGGGALCIAISIGEGYLFDRLLGLTGRSNSWHWPVMLCLLILDTIVLLWLSRVAYVRWVRS